MSGITKQLADRINAACANAYNHETIADDILKAFHVDPLGTPIEFEDIRVGDTIRAEFTENTVDEYRTGVVIEIAQHWAVGGSEGNRIAIGHRDHALYLLHRQPQPTLSDLQPGEVEDKGGKVWMYDGKIATRRSGDGSYSHLRDGKGDLDAAPWRQVSTLTPVSQPEPEALTLARRTITDLDEVEALPLGSVYRLNRPEYVMEKLAGGWYRPGVEYAYQPQDSWVPGTLIMEGPKQ